MAHIAHLSRLQQPSNFREARHLFQPKYGQCVFKYQLIINHKGVPIWMSGPHLGPTGDAKLWERKHPHLEPWEFLLADGAYGGSHHTVCPWRKNSAHYNEYVNNVISFYRARVERTIGIVKSHAMFDGKLRWTRRAICAAVKLCVHATAVDMTIRSQWSDNYTDTIVGPHRHDEPLRQHA